MDQHVHFVTLGVTDLEAGRRFYVDGLGWEPLLHVPGEVLFFQVAHEPRPSATAATVSAMHDRWEWASSPQAASVPRWMRVGPKRDGVLHGTLVYLVRMRQSTGSHLEWAYRPSAEIHSEIIARYSVSESETLKVLQELETPGLVEQRAAPDNQLEWRATPAAVIAVERAYAHRHPLREE